VFVFIVILIVILTIIIFLKQKYYKTKIKESYYFMRQLSSLRYSIIIGPGSYKFTS